MYPPILLLPLELKQLIVKLSSGSPINNSSLAALAQTHTSYQREAEKALYDSLHIYDSLSRSLKCLETLATNPEKAVLVRFLTFVCTLNAGSMTPRSSIATQLTTYLSKSLINMRSLSEFRVRVSPAGTVSGPKMMKDLSRILCQGHFRLQTFYCSCDDLPNISEIIKSQIELQILGLYTNVSERGIILKTLKELHNVQTFLPIVLTLETRFLIIDNDHIGIFPAFYSVDRFATIHQVLALSFCKDQRRYHDMVSYLKADYINELSIYLFDSSDMPSIYALVKGMAVTLPRITRLNLWFERRCEIPQEIREEFSSSFFRSIMTHVWPTV